jgi:hypothetical protein
MELMLFIATDLNPDPQGEMCAGSPSSSKTST